MAVKAQSGPQGEKVPATGGTVADRFVLLQVMAAFEMEPPRLAVDRTEALALRARVFRSEGLCLLFQEGGDGSLDQSAADLPGQILHDAEVDVQPRSVRPKARRATTFPHAAANSRSLRRSSGLGVVLVMAFPPLHLRHGSRRLSLPFVAQSLLPCKAGPDLTIRWAFSRL